MADINRMDWPLTIAIVFAAWVAVSLIGYERQRLIDVDAATHPPEAGPTIAEAGQPADDHGHTQAAPRRAA